ncbi:MAG TPA: undecaprenyl-diphosphate phosphatase [Candidatus Avoscillospira avicola]|uniref:Undecaprenyl-diphosphatase n=1 Tax=Candidatus Avoscillospira avicola TaxID=2840706 RepID=A0A9D1DIH8_9FIRM|nr:undecaprenyl-diphosphate phosphatase [Candidatus Avoscillospira avicola]
MTYISAIFLGLIQGLAEFLPISSSGHLAFFQEVVAVLDAGEESLFFDVLLHLGTLVAVFVAYRAEIKSLILEFFTMVGVRKLPQGQKPDRLSRRMILFIILGTLPLFAVLPVKDFVEGLYSNPMFIGCAFLGTGLILFLSDRLSRGNKDVKNASILDVLLVGCGQALATVPGISRSGTTISVGLARGFSREFAVKYSFLLSIPAVLGANILSLIDAVGEGIDWSRMPMYLAGVATAMISGYLAIRLLKYISRKSSFGGFAYYCWGIGLVTLILSLVK